MKEITKKITKFLLIIIGIVFFDNLLDVISHGRFDFMAGLVGAFVAHHIFIKQEARKDRGK